MATPQKTDKLQIRDLGTILGVWAHPDDESFTMGGVMAAATDNHQRVACITATRGEQGTHDPKRWPPEKLALAREHELDEALAILGVREHYWLDYHDGHCHEIKDAEAIDKVAAIMEQVRPDTIITFGPEGMTGHPDHQAVSRWTQGAVQRYGLNDEVRLLHAVASREWYETSGKALDATYDMFFMIDEPPLCSHDEADFCFELTDELMERKLGALRVQETQHGPMFTQEPETVLREMSACELFVYGAPVAA